eukprot:TRINITY_DN17209_c0_g1_i1.p1 TRINITY_DN17209_c0_g1~~TRINITY_DN17209_c0_g1_i1.p1  ORF type:complete len:786 (+),score=145.25 TRINITY_DN17209_c0_g1_i1:101-2458(+)
MDQSPPLSPPSSGSPMDPVSVAQHLKQLGLAEMGEPPQYAGDEHGGALETVFRGGGYGMAGSWVYRGWHPETPEKVLAVKRMPVNNFIRRGELSAAERELQCLRAVCGDPNCVHLVEAYVSPASEHASANLWIAMLWCPGGSVAGLMRLRQAPLREPEIAAVMVGAVHGLGKLHACGWLHRDLRAENLLLQLGPPRCVLSDFGSASPLSNPRLGQPGAAHWQAPEGIRSQEYGTASDLWSLGITCIELGDNETPSQRMGAPEDFAHAFKESPTLRSPADWSASFQRFVALCLAIEPTARADCETLAGEPFLANTTSAEVEQVIGEAVEAVVAAHHSERHERKLSEERRLQRRLCTGSDHDFDAESSLCDSSPQLPLLPENLSPQAGDALARRSSRHLRRSPGSGSMLGSSAVRPAPAVPPPVPAPAPAPTPARDTARAPAAPQSSRERRSPAATALALPLRDRPASARSGGQGPFQLIVPTPVQAPKCREGHILVLSRYDKGLYQHGWLCGQCGFEFSKREKLQNLRADAEKNPALYRKYVESFDEQMERWYCPTCNDDRCFRCLPRREESLEDLLREELRQLAEKHREINSRIASARLSQSGESGEGAAVNGSGGPREGTDGKEQDRAVQNSVLAFLRHEISLWEKDQVADPIARMETEERMRVSEIQHYDNSMQVCQTHLRGLLDQIVASLAPESPAGYGSSGRGQRPSSPARRSASPDSPPREEPPNRASSSTHGISKRPGAGAEPHALRSQRIRQASYTPHGQQRAVRRVTAQQPLPRNWS